MPMNTDSGAGGTVFVVSGLPRSGTSMMMAMLQAGGLSLLTDAARAPDASNPRGYFEYEPVRRLRVDKSWVSLAVGKGLKVVSYLLTELPDVFRYRIVFMERPLPEVLESQRVMLESQDEPHDPATEQILARTYEKHLAHIAAWLAEQPNMRILHVSFHDALKDPLPISTEVAEFMGASLDPRAMAAAVEPALRHQRK